MQCWSLGERIDIEYDDMKAEKTRVDRFETFGTSWETTARGKLEEEGNATAVADGLDGRAT